MPTTTNGDTFSVNVSDLEQSGATLNQTIVWNGSVWAAHDPNTVTLGTAQNGSSNARSFVFTGIPSTAKKVNIMLHNVALAQYSDLMIQLGSSGSLRYTGYNAGTLAGPEDGKSGGYANTFGFIAAGTGGSTISGLMSLCTMGGNIWAGSGTFTAGSMSIISGSVALPGVLDRVGITSASNSPISAGNLNISWQT